MRNSIRMQKLDALDKLRNAINHLTNSIKFRGMPRSADRHHNNLMRRVVRRIENLNERYCVICSGCFPGFLIYILQNSHLSWISYCVDCFEHHLGAVRYPKYHTSSGSTKSNTPLWI